MSSPQPRLSDVDRRRREAIAIKRRRRFRLRALLLSGLWRRS